MRTHIKTILLGTLLIMSINIACTDQNSKDKQPINAEDIILNNIHSRKSVRQYKDRGVEEEKIMALLKAGMAAPSGKDTRPWEFVVVNERAALDSMASALPYAKMLSKVRQAIIVCGDSGKSSYWYLDCSAAAQNILLAAEALGLGAVWTAAYPYEDRMEVVRKYTNLPENVKPLCVIPVGYPEGVQSPKNKFDESKIHLNRY